MRVAILQRVCTQYRVPLFQSLSFDSEIEFHLFIGDDVPDSKVKNADNLTGINYTRLKSYFIKLRGHYFPIHTDLIKKIREYKPDIIICEGESNFFGYLQAIFYKNLYKRKTKLVHWCFIALPGENLNDKPFIAKVKSFFRLFFDGFLVYSNYSKHRLLEIGGVPENKIFVATNVGDTKKSLIGADSVFESKKQIRHSLGIKDNFTVTYLGTLDKNKRPDLLLEIAKFNQDKNLNFLILGSGPMLEQLMSSVQELALDCVYLPGRIIDDLPLYLKASDVLIIPGRGGIVISEAMAYSLPVIVHECDGTENDLIKHNFNGLHLKKGDLKDFCQAIRLLQLNPKLCSEMGKRGKLMVEEIYNTKNMVIQIKSAVNYLHQF